MARARQPQKSFDFARRGRKTGGLDEAHHAELLARLREDARRVAAEFRLPPFELEADRPDARSRYGQCDSDGHVVVRLVNVRTGRVLKHSAMIDTVVHELAHLRHMNHGPRWEALYQRMLEWARSQGIYDPRPVTAPVEPSVPPREPHQLALFTGRGSRGPS